MKYSKFMHFWVAEPENWADLREMIHHQPKFLTSNPHIELEPVDFVVTDQEELFKLLDN